MYQFCKVLLLMLLCIHNCALNTAAKGPLKDMNDFDVQERNYQKFLIQSQDDDINENSETNKLASVSEGLSDSHKSAYVGSRNKFRMRHSRNGKMNRNRRVQNSDTFDSHSILQNTISNNDDEEISAVASLAGTNDITSRFPAKKRTAARRWPLKSLQKFGVFNEKLKNVINEQRESGNEGNAPESYDTKSKAKGNENLGNPMDGNYVLMPEPNQLVVVKNLSLPERVRDSQNDNLNPTNRRLIMTIQSDKPRLISIPEEAQRNNDGDQACKGINPKDEEETEEFKGKTLPDDSDGAKMSNNENLKKVKEEIINCTSNRLEKYFKLLEQKDEKYNGKSDLQNSQCAQKAQEEPNRDMMHVNITINGLLMDNDKTSKIHGNASIKFHANDEEERKRRATKFFKKLKGKKGKEEGGDEYDEDLVSLEDDDEPESDEACGEKSKPDAGLTPDGLSNEIVKMVSHMVRSNPQMKILWPSLKNNRPTQKTTATNLRTISQSDCSGRKKIEEMLRKAMAAVNEIIKKEVQSRSCVPLSTELAEFYEVILEMHAKQAKKKEEHEEKLIQAENLDKENEEETEAPKKKTCKPDAGADLQDDGLFDMMHLRKLEYDNEIAEVRRRRETEKRTHELISDTVNSSLVEKLHQMYTPAFFKLNSVVETLERVDEESEPV